MDAICFDMDGVVVDSERHWVPIENERILPETVESGHPTADEITGMNVRDLYGYLDEEYGTTMDEEGFVARYDDAAAELYTERVDLLEGFETLCGQMRERNVAVALVSASPRRWIGFVLDRFDLHGCFDLVVSAEDIAGPSKPEPHVYEHAAAGLGIPTDGCVAVEDSAHGVEAAAAAGMSVLGYRTGANGSQDLAAADAVATGPADLRRRLKVRCE